MTSVFSRVIVSAVCSAALFGAAPALAKNLLTNGSFNDPIGNGSASFTGLYEGPSAAQYWTVFNNYYGTTATQLVPSPRFKRGYMIHVTTTGNYSGLEQVFTAQGKKAKYVCAWVYVNSGVVGAGAGTGGGTGIDVVSTTTGQWQMLLVKTPAGPINETILYSYGGAADFYVESDSVSSSSKPCKPE